LVTLVSRIRRTELVCAAFDDSTSAKFAFFTNDGPMSNDDSDSKNLMPADSANEADLELMVRDNIGWMLALAERLLRDRAYAEDVVQESFMAAFRGLAGFEGRSSHKTWLHRITVNTALDKLRQIKRQAEKSIDPLQPEFDRYDCRIEMPWPHLPEVAELVENEETRELLHRCIGELPDSYRILLLLRDVEGYDTREVAKALGITEANVKVRLHRARAALKKMMEPLLRGGAEL
jgi:RNA polymerase sigma-70 factor (ECF subfamily)